MASTSESNVREATTSADVRQDECAPGEEDVQLWEDMDDICLLCEKHMEPSKSSVMKERGINNLVKASIKRKDKKHVQLQNLQEITAKFIKFSYPRIKKKL